MMVLLSLMTKFMRKMHACMKRFPYSYIFSTVNYHVKKFLITRLQIYLDIKQDA